jgi:hypothetical protein
MLMLTLSIVAVVVCLPVLVLALMLHSEEKLLAKEKARRREVYRQIYSGQDPGATVLPAPVYGG